jgi:hypothetical protein
MSTLRANLRLLLLFHPFLAVGGPPIFQAGPAPERKVTVQCSWD